VRGIRATCACLAGFHYQLWRYGPTRKDWLKRVYPTPGNVSRVFADKDRNVARAQGMLDRIDALKPRITAEAYDEFRLCFGNLLALARRWQAAHKQAMMLWAIKQGTIRPTLAQLEALSAHTLAANDLRETLSP
jgi:hypothetical protein